ncbi:unnamed protein product, partial [Choristocarpus tenellus]
SRLHLALTPEGFGTLRAATDRHLRRFQDKEFHIVPRRIMMQIQTSSSTAICNVLSKHNQTNTWQERDACVVEQCLSALYFHTY